MKPVLALFVCGVSVLAVALALIASRELPRQVSAGGNRLRMHPAIVFECFGPANLEIWNRVQSEVARFACAVTYDHGGYWGSE